MLYGCTKRFFDVLAAGCGLVAAAPLLAVAAGAAWAAGLRPVLFRQRRIGRRAEAFTLVKLRTLTDARDPATGRLRPDAERRHPVGDWLRRTHLDELPQLWLVLTGRMSLVGPRPLLPEYLPRYTAAQRTRHRVRPGLTGWAQVHGGNALPWERRLALDAWYAAHASWALDGRILWRTARQLLNGGRRGAASAPADEFLGQNHR